MPLPFPKLPVLSGALSRIKCEMRFTPTANLDPDRLLSYVEELREFSQTYRLTFGKPEDLQRLCDRLADDEPFLLDFRAMIRSIVYRENCQLTASDLVELVGFTWTGQGSHDLNGSLGRSRCDLAAMLRQTMTLPRIEPAEPEDSDGTAPSSGELPHSEVRPAILFSPGDESTLTLAIRNRDAVDAGKDQVAEPSASAIRVEPWWAESNLPRTIGQSASTENPVVHNGGNAGEANVARANPWLDDSAFHQELLEFDRQRQSRK